MSPSIQQRGNKYYFRTTVPARLIEIFGVKEIRLALNTNNSLKAQKLYEEYEIEYNTLIDRLDRHLRLGSRMTDREIADAVSRFVPSKGEKAHFKNISDVCDEFIKFHETGWALRTKQEVEFSLLLFQKFFGFRKAITDLKVDDADKFLAYLKQLKAEGRDTVIDGKTANKHMSRVYSMVNFAISRGWSDRNPFFGIRVKLDKTKKREKKRLPFTEEEHQKIVDMVLEYPNLAGEYQRPSMFWVPLLCMFSGCRRNEACQLYREDIVEVDGIMCVRIDNDKPDKRLKNESSRRVTPLHSMLIKFGFLDYVNKFEPGERLFPELKYFRDGYGHSFKRFQPQLRKLVTQDERKVMHSFRHMISGQLMQKGQHTVWRADLLGHSRGEVETDATYTELTKIRTLKRMLELIEYPSINFDRCQIKHYRLAPKFKDDDTVLPVYLSSEVHNFLLTLDNYNHRAQWLSHECNEELSGGKVEATIVSDSLDHHVLVRQESGRIYVNLCVEGDGTDDSDENDDYEIEF